MHYLVHVQTRDNPTLQMHKRLFDSVERAQGYADRLLCDSAICTVWVSATTGSGTVWERSRTLAWKRLAPARRLAGNRPMADDAVERREQPFMQRAQFTR